MDVPAKWKKAIATTDWTDNGDEEQDSRMMLELCKRKRLDLHSFIAETDARKTTLYGQPNAQPQDKEKRSGDCSKRRQHAGLHRNKRQPSIKINYFLLPHSVCYTCAALPRARALAPPNCHRAISASISADLNHLLWIVG